MTPTKIEFMLWKHEANSIIRLYKDKSYNRLMNYLDI
jgi:hypothetical protein